MYEIFFSPKAKKQFENLEKRFQRKMDKEIDKLKREPYPKIGSRSIKLRNSRLADYRKTIGKWRILYDIYERENNIYILHIRRRDEKTYSER